MINQHPSLYSSRHPRPRSTQALSHHHMRAQLGIRQAFTYPGTRRGSSGAHIPLNPHHGVHPVNTMPVNPPPIGLGGPRSLHPGYNVR
jgi:hypothetical protein